MIRSAVCLSLLLCLFIVDDVRAQSPMLGSAVPQRDVYGFRSGSVFGKNVFGFRSSGSSVLRRDIFGMQRRTLLGRGIFGSRQRSLRRDPFRYSRNYFSGGRRYFGSQGYTQAPQGMVDRFARRATDAAASVLPEEEELLEYVPEVELPNLGFERF